MKTSWKVELPQWLMLGAMFVAGAVAWPSAPDRIPMHWNLHGHVDRYGGKFEGLFLLPLAAAGLYVLMRVLPRVDPGRANYDRFSGSYGVIRIAVLGVFVVLYGMVQAFVWTGHADVSQLAPLLIGALFIVFGAVLGKIRPNWFVGVRTPWTLSSKVAWVRTHRAGGWVFMLVGVATLVSAVISPRAAFWVLIVGGAGGALCLVVYSYLVWRKDPDKLPPAGTLPAD